VPGSTSGIRCPVRSPDWIRLLLGAVTILAGIAVLADVAFASLVSRGHHLRCGCVPHAPVFVTLIWPAIGGYCATPVQTRLLINPAPTARNAVGP
jgi:hypothetical protein